MKQFILIFLAIAACCGNLYAQKRNEALVQLSINQLELDYQRSLLQQTIWGEVYLGTGNQDINSRFDDFLAGIRLGKPVFISGRNELHLVLNTGVYIPQNKYYSATAWVGGGGLRYVRLIGKSEKHGLLLSTGYQYGKRSYKQEYRTGDIYVSTIGNFEMPSFYLKIGYGFRF